MSGQNNTFYNPYDVYDPNIAYQTKQILENSTNKFPQIEVDIQNSKFRDKIKESFLKNLKQSKNNEELLERLNKLLIQQLKQTNCVKQCYLYANQENEQKIKLNLYLEYKSPFQFNLGKSRYNNEHKTHQLTSSIFFQNLFGYCEQIHLGYRFSFLQQRKSFGQFIHLTSPLEIRPSQFFFIQSGYFNKQISEQLKEESFTNVLETFNSETRNQIVFKQKYRKNILNQTNDKNQQVNSQQLLEPSILLPSTLYKLKFVHFFQSITSIKGYFQNSQISGNMGLDFDNKSGYVEGKYQYNQIFDKDYQFEGKQYKLQFYNHFALKAQFSSDNNRINDHLNLQDYPGFKNFYNNIKDPQKIFLQNNFYWRFQDFKILNILGIRPFFNFNAYLLPRQFTENKSSIKQVSEQLKLSAGIGFDSKILEDSKVSFNFFFFNFKNPLDQACKFQIMFDRFA